MGYNSSNRGPTLETTSWVLTAISTVLVVLRILSRTVFSTFKAGLDDALAVFSQLVLLAFAISISVAVGSGAGQHIKNIPPDQVVTATYDTVIMNALTVWTFTIPKLPIVVLMQRLFRPPKYTVIAFWIITVIGIAGSLATCLVLILQCDPPRRLWNHAVPGTCLSVNVLGGMGWFLSAWSAFLDLFFAVWPQAYVAKLNMPLKQRLLIGTALGLGLIAFVFSIIKLAIISSVLDDLATDFTWAIIPLDLWSSVEANVLVTVSCLPTIGPFIRFIIAKTMPSRAPTKDTTYSAYPVTSELDRSTGGKKKLSTLDGSATYGCDVDGIPLVDQEQEMAAVSSSSMRSMPSEEDEFHRIMPHRIVKKVDIEQSEERIPWNQEKAIKDMLGLNPASVFPR